MNTKQGNVIAQRARAKAIREEFEHCDNVFSALNFLVNQGPNIAAALLYKTQPHIANKLYFWMRTTLKNEHPTNYRPEYFGSDSGRKSYVLSVYARIIERLADLKYPYLTQAQFEISQDTSLNWHRQPLN